MRFLSMLLLLGACGSVSLSTIVQLSRLDPLTANPDGFVAAIALPDALDIPEGGATLGFFWAYAGTTIGGTYTLQRQAGVGPAPADGQHVLVFDLTPTDAASIRQTQQQIIALKADGVAGEGTFSVYAIPCAHGEVATPRLSTYIQVEADGAFLPLLRDYDISADMALGQLPACIYALARAGVVALNRRG